MNSCKYLFLRSISEETELRLKLIVEEARPQARLVSAPLSNPNLKPLYVGNPIESDSRCQLFEVIYDYPISYTVLNETYGLYPKKPEVFTGELFRVFSWSYLLEMTRKITYADDDHPGPGPLQHHEIACLNHIVDIITSKEPEMRLLRGSAAQIMQ